MQLIQSAQKSARETYDGLRWVWIEVLSPESRRNQMIALIFLVLTNLCQMGMPYLFKEVIDTHAVAQFVERNRWLGYTIVLSVAAALLGVVYDYFREHAWNNNYLTSNLTVVRKLFDRTLDELVSEASEIGVEQAESIKDRVQNILYLFMFELSVVMVAILSATALVYTIDPVVGLFVFGLTLFNLVWFMIFNAKLDEVMDPIDKQFRRANRRMVEKLTYAQSVKAGGVEQKIARQIEAEIKEPLAADLYIWAGWFLQIETIRRLVNALVPMGIIWYGMDVSGWSAGTISAMFLWIFLIAREYGFIGHLMRHLSSQVARLKAARKALERAPSFRFDVGASYEPTK